MITVYYDGKCGLCAKEINYYRTTAPAGIFDWKDVTEHYVELEPEGISLADGLRLLHARDHDGKLHIGVDAFLLMWRQMSYWKVLAVVVNLPLIRQITEVVYQLFAKKRFEKLSHCQLAAKEESR